MAVPDARRWNGNIHYHKLIADTVAGARSILDIGCGEGMLARRLRAGGAEVTGIDLDEPSIDLARAQESDGITYIRGDFLEYPFAPESFDAIVSVATLHHMDAVAALKRVAELLRPGGTAALVGLARDVHPRDLPYSLAGAVAYRYHRITKKDWLHPSPMVWPPPATNSEMRRHAEQVLPGARFRRHLLWRYSIVWRKP